MSAGSDYQRLRAHLAFLRMSAAAEALPALLDEAVKAKLGRVPRGGVRGVGCDGLLVNRELTGFGGQLGDY